MVPPVLDLTSPPHSFSQLLCLFWQSDLAVIWIFCDAFGNFWHQFYVWENCVCSWFCQFIFLVKKLRGFWHPWRPTLPWRTPYRSRSGRHGLSSSWQVATAKFNPNSVTEKGNLSLKPFFDMRIYTSLMTQYIITRYRQKYKIRKIDVLYLKERSNFTKNEKPWNLGG